MGTPDFAVASLEALVNNGYPPIAVVTAPDKPAGRGQKLNSSPVKKYALQNGLQVLQPVNLKDENFLSELRALKADLQLVVAFRMLPEAVWNMPPLGTYNLHASLLPRYRGAAPINWAIIRGERETGLTTFRLKQEIDSGEVLFTEKVKIGNDTTAGELHDELMKKGAQLLIRSVKEIELAKNENRVIRFEMQDESAVTHAPKLSRETCRISWHRPIADVYNLIRGLSPYPGAFCVLNAPGGKHHLLKIFRCVMVPAETTMAYGSVVTDQRSFIKVSCNGGFLEILELQLEGKNRMDVAGFLRGFRFAEGSILA